MWTSCLRPLDSTTEIGQIPAGEAVVSKPIGPSDYKLRINLERKERCLM
jgi:hypothetical protein